MTDHTACVAPGTITSEDLLAWADGDADVTTSAHIEGCRACRDEALDDRRLSHLLATGLARVDCPPVATLANYAYDLLAPVERTEVAAHLVSCGSCMEELRALREDLAVAALPSPDAVPLLERLATAVATLVRPATAGLGWAGARGADSGAAQAATYEADDVQISVHVAPPRAAGAMHATVQGLVQSATHSGDDLTRTRVDLSCRDIIVATADLDEFGTFTLAAPLASDYAVRVSFPDRAVVIPALLQE